MTDRTVQGFKVHRHKKFYLPKLVQKDSSAIKNMAFENCHIYGPAVAYATETDFIDCTFGGSRDSIVWPIDPELRPEIAGAILLFNVQFLRCTTRNIGFVATPDMQLHFMLVDDAPHPSI